MATIDLGTEARTGKKKRRRNKPLTATGPRYSRDQKVKGGTLERSRKRLKRTGPVKGVNAKDGITGREARKIKRADRKHPGRTGNRGQNGSRHPVRDPFAQEVNAETNLRFRGPERQLSDQRAQEQQFGQNQNEWYGQHVRDLQLAQQTQAAFQQGLVAAQNMAVQNAATTDQNANTALLQQAQTSATQRGATVDPALAQTMQQGVAARQATGVAGTNLLSQQAQAQGSYMANQVVQGSQQAVQAQQDTQNRQRKLAQLAQDLAADKGDYKVKARREIQDTQHKQRLEEAAFGLDVQQERNDQRNANRDDRRLSKAERRQQRESRSRNRDRRNDNQRQNAADQERARHNRQTERNARRTENRQRAKDLADDGRLNGSTSSGGTKGSNFTPTQVRSGRQKLRNLVGRVQNNVDPPASVDPLLAQAAVQIADHGGCNPRLAAKIKRQYGFTPKIRRVKNRAQRGLPIHH